MLIKTYERPQPKKKRKKNIAHFLANSNSDMFDALSANNFKNYKALVKSKSNKENRPKKNKMPKLTKQPTRGALETSAKLNKSRSSRKRVTVLESKNKLQRNVNVAKFKDSADSPNSPDTTFDRLLKCSKTPLTECNQPRNQISHTPVASVSSSTHNNNSPLEDSLHVFITRRSHKKVSERGPVDTRKSSKRLRWKCLDNDIYDFNRDVYVTRRSTEQLPNRKNVRVLSAPNSFAWRHLNISGLQLSPCNDESQGINDFNPDIHVTRRSNEQHTNGENLRVISSLDSARRRLNISRLQLSPVDNQSLTVSEDYNPVVSKGSITRRSSERLLKKMHSEADISRRSSRKMDSVVNEKNLSTFDCNNSLDCEASIKSGDLSLTDAVGGINSVNSITKKSLCRRLSHQIIPDKRISGRRASAFRTAKSMKPTDISCNSASVSIIAEEDESLICEESEDMSVANLCNAKNLVLSRCKQSEPIAFEKAFPQRYFHNSKKIGEGVYGEVFLCTRDNGNTVVLKIVPIEGEIVVNGEKQKKYHEILSEVTIAMELSNLRNDSQFSTDCFVEVVSCKCVQGKYPSKLIDLWNEYSSTRGTENDPPSVFDEQQLFIVFELADGGQSLESYHFTSAAQSFSAFMQTSFALAVAENALEFEHRDLHWGNILISKTAATSIEYKLNGKSHFVPSNGIKVTIIDYTLSRMTYDFCCIFNDLELDPLLFTANGDYQFEIYRLMRDALKSDWSDYSPYTNILWLHYIVGKMLSQVNYKMKKTKTHKTHVNDLRKYYKCILTFKSCYEFVASKII